MDKEYFAFISYQRQDEEWAKWLADQLEHYHLPLTLNGRDDLPQNLRPIFRDIDELAAGNLPKQIYQALKNSKNLIVVCSPNSAKSPWVNKEVETFIGMGKLDNIFPFIIDGVAFSKNEEEECMPKALRKLPKDKERLGANVNEYKDGPQRLCKDCPLPKDNREDKRHGNISEKGPNAAVVKIVAGMLGLHFDALWQRYEKEKIEEERRIKEQRDKLYIAQSRFLAEKASDLVDENNAFLGRLLSLEALPSNVEEPERPYVPVAELALRKACSNHSAVIHGHNSGCLFASFSSDGRYVVSGSADKTARIWNVSDCRQIMVLNHTESVDFAYFNDNGKYIITTSEWGNAINIWDAQTGQIFHKIEGHEGGVLSAVYTHDGKWIISASRDNSIRKWDSKTYEEVLRITGRGNGFRWAFPSPDGRTIISSCFDNSVRIWDANTGDHIKTICSLNNWPPFPTYSPDGQYIATAADTHAIIWDANSFEILLDIKASEYCIKVLAFSPDGQKLATISDDKVICIWDTRVCHPIKSVRGQLLQKFQGHTMDIFSCQFSPDGKRLVTASWDQTIRIWDIDEHIVFHYDESKCAFSYAEFSPNSKLAAVVYNDNVIRLYEVTGFQPKGALIGHTDFPKFVHFSTDGKRIVSSAADNSVRVWDVDKRICIKVFVFDRNLSEARFNPNGNILGISDYKHIYLYNTRDWTLIHDIEIPGFHGSQFITFSPDGSKFATAQGAGIHIYDVNTGSEEKTVNIHPLDISMLRYNVNGDYLYFLSYHSLYRIDVETMTKIEKFEGHSENIRTFAFSSDQRFVATAAYDKTLRIWDVENRNHIHTCVGHTWGVSSVNFQPDGRTVISSSFDGTFRKWNFPPLQELIDESRMRVYDHPLTPEERKQYYLD